MGCGVWVGVWVGGGWKSQQNNNKNLLEIRLNEYLNEKWD